jgi:hypothetical protein
MALRDAYGATVECDVTLDNDGSYYEAVALVGGAITGDAVGIGSTEALAIADLEKRALSVQLLAARVKIAGLEGAAQVDAARIDYLERVQRETDQAALMAAIRAAARAA